LKVPRENVHGLNIHIREKPINKFNGHLKFNDHLTGDDAAQLGVVESQFLHASQSCDLSNTFYPNWQHIILLFFVLQPNRTVKSRAS